MDLSVLGAFLVAVLVISASPGPAVALILRRAGLDGGRAALATVLGLEAGLYLWALAAGAGLAALVAASEVAYTVLRVVGAAVLLFLGVRALREARRLRRLADGADGAEGAAGVAATRRGAGDGGGRGSWRARFLEGLVIQLANPKAAVFLFAFYPQFVPAGEGVLLRTAALAGVQVLVETVLYGALALAVGRASAWFRRPRVRSRLELASGAVLVGLGVRVAATSR